MSQNKPPAQSAAQAGPSGEATGVGPAADFHPRSYGFRPGHNAHQALDDIVEALRSGRLEVVDADLSKYFDTIPHDRLMKLVARRTSDGSILHLIGQWLDAPVAEEVNGRRKVLPNRQGVPQGGVISPLLANLYLNGLDWAVNDPSVRGQPVLVRYADDFIILCAPGQGTALRQRLERWLDRRGLKLNEEKTRVADSRRGLDFLGFRVRWQRWPVRGSWYAHVEASPRSQQRLRAAVRTKLNHWTLGKRIPEVMTGLKPVIARLGGLLPLPAKQPGNGQAQRASARPGATVAVAQTREETGLVERLPRGAAGAGVWPVAAARAGEVEESVREQTEC